MKKYFITIVMISLVSFSCDREDVLPKPTQEGNNTFGCLVNGEIWKPKGRRGPLSNLRVRFNNDDFFRINAFIFLENEERENIYIYIVDMELNTIKSYDLGNTQTGTASYANTSGCDYSQHDSTVAQSGTLTITRFDSGIIAGTFEFTLEKPNCETIRVTEGRFDLKF